MKSLNKFALGVIGVALLSSCQSVSTKQVPEVLCQDPRPEICTMDYNPVCGFADDMIGKTYSNACSACSDQSVNGYTYGECSVEDK